MSASQATQDSSPAPRSTSEGARAAGDSQAGSNRTVLRAVAGPFWMSTLVVLFSGLFASVKVGTGGSTITNFGSFLTVPGGHWDGSWYLNIATTGYVNPNSRGFFPLYPLLIHVLGFVTGVTYAAVLISLGALFAALFLLYRLTELDFSAQVARTTVALVAFCPMAFFFSAMYTESLFLALSVGAIYAARRERWVIAGVAGALASATRNSGVLMLVPILLLYLYGPRGNAQAPRWDWSTSRARTLLPRYRPRWNIWPVVLVPVGVVAFTVYLALQYHAGLDWITAQEKYFGHTSSDPISGFINGATTAWTGLSNLVAAPAGPLVSSPDSTNILNFAACIIGLVAVIGCIRTLPFAYSAYSVLAFIVPLASPTATYPLNSVPRYQMVIFPLFIWFAQFLERKRWSSTAIAGSAVLLGLFSAMFAVGPWVA